ncbi:PLP-dependent aminotransferase family protein [Amycolatopsis sp. NBC_00345]|uniref:aminotransferase-like domain-containing protein n=1 Tax=Amycolatopsis sp. NBC_00345 TaxID=2975955 RepID=UPI002E269F16
MSDDSSSRIVAGLREWLATAPPGARVPSTRALVAQYGASPVTVQKALSRLAAHGVVESRPGVGTFVRAARTARPNDYGWQTAALGSPNHRIPDQPAALQTVSNDMIALHSGYPDRELLPDRLVRAAFTRAARSDSPVDRPSTAGLPALQAWFAAELESATPAGTSPVTPGDVVVIPGSQGGLSTAFRALAGAGRPLLVESPTYWGAILAAAQVGVDLVPVPSGPGGPDPEALSRLFEQSGARALYAQPSFASPTGALWSPELTGRVLEVVRHHGAFLIEDDAAHDFGITADPRPVAALDDGGHVVYLRSLSKSVSPAVRVAALIARGPARKRILADTQAESMYVSGVLQAVALDVVTQPAWRTHLRRLRHQLKARRDLLATSLGEHAPGARLDALPQGGLNLWVRLPDTVDLGRFLADCTAAGVVIGPGGEWFPAEPTGQFIRLNYAGPNPGAFPDGARAIGRALERAAER